MPLLPVAFYGLEVPAGDILVPSQIDFPATIRITMAAIDPSESAEIEEGTNGLSRPRATLKLMRQQEGSEDDEESAEYMRALLAESDSEDDDEDDEEEEAEEANGGPSDPKKSKKAKKDAELQKLIDSIGGGSEDDEDMADAPTDAKVSKKGKAKATDDDDEDEEEEEDSDDEELDIDDFEEYVLCTLDPEKNYQQTLDVTIGENERVFFRVSGTHKVYVTGNYVIDESHNRHHEIYDSDEDDEDDEDYDLSPDEDELELELDGDESDDLDNLEDPRITEVDSEDEVEAPKLVEKKGKNKRSAAELDGASLDDIMSKSLKPEAADEQKLSKKQLKKLKKNNGEAAAAKPEEITPAKSDKKVQFAKNLEQGPTGSAEKAKPEASKANTGKATLGVKTVDGVKVDDKKLGTGPACKKGNRVSMRYIGKLTDGKLFDSNKKGAPFSFKLGSGEVIKGWDIGVAGMSVGGERRLTIPPHLAYGSKSIPKIPGNSTLIFDVKLLEIK